MQYEVDPKFGRDGGMLLDDQTSTFPTLGTPTFFETIVERSMDPIAIIDENLILHYVSGSIRDLLGWEPEHWVGRSIADVLEPGSFEVVMQGITEWNLAPHDPTEPEAAVRIYLRAKDGRVVPVDAMVRDSPRSGVAGYVAQLRPAAGPQALSDAVDALLEGGHPDQALWQLASLIEHAITRTVAALGTGWDGDRFTETAGDNDLIDLTNLRDQGRDAIRFALRSGQTVSQIWDLLAPETRARAEARGLRTCWCAPMVDDRFTAVLLVWHTHPGPPGVVYQTSINRAVNLTRLALRWASQQRQLAWDVAHDQLTGLTNRAEFQNRLDASAGRRRAVLFCDLDDFKPVNERLGHRAGDEVLAAVAGRLGSTCRSCVVARLGGDEFAILMVDPTDIDDALELAGRVRGKLADPIAVVGQSVRVGVTIGVAFDTVGSAHSDLLMDEADRLLRIGKSRGKNQVLSVVITA